MSSSGQIPPPPPSHQCVNLGKAVKGGQNNAVYTTKYTLLTFLPIAIGEQFRRNGNVYFLCCGILMFIGEHFPDLFHTAVEPWTTLGPLAIVVSISLIQEGVTDYKRRSSDYETNNHPCVVLRRAEDLGTKHERVENIMDGHDVDVKLVPRLSKSPLRKSHLNIHHREKDSTKVVDIAFTSTKRKDIRAGEIVLVRNRDMVPADLIILGSSGENGSAYVETSQIDGETNLKLRKSPRLPDNVIETPTPTTQGQAENYKHPKFETISQAVKRITRLSHLGYPDGISVLHEPCNATSDTEDSYKSPARRPSLLEIAKSLSFSTEIVDEEKPKISNSTRYIATLTSELPNASVNTFAGKITLPSVNTGSPGVRIPLDVENFLLRGAALRNTDWIIGLACFTGSDTKLVRNSVKTPSKFSRLDVLMNRTVLLILCVMLVCVIGIGIQYALTHDKYFDTLWYIGYNKNASDLWPYLSDGFQTPKWTDEAQNAFQSMLNSITLFNNFVPLSLYICVEIATLFMIKLISWDKNMYHEETDTCAVARSTIVSDLGQVEYVFSDKTGTLTQNVMKFKRCSVDGMMFGAPVEKSAPIDRRDETEIEGLNVQKFHPLKRLLVGQITLNPNNNVSLDVMMNEVEIEMSNTRGIRSIEDRYEPLTFNAEMFLRVMSICHTVVVEKELDPAGIGTKKGESDSVSSSGMSFPWSWKRPRTQTEDSMNSKFEPIFEKSPSLDSYSVSDYRSSNEISNEINLLDTNSQAIVGKRIIDTTPKSVNGAPAGYTYQAESPDEEALVSAASLEFGFQLKRRDANGLILSCEYPSLLSIEALAKGIKSGNATAKKIASRTAQPQLNLRGDGSLISLKKALSDCFENEGNDDTDLDYSAFNFDINTPVEENWTILAVNKFDSTRKRMSVVVRSPPELGSIPMLLCKGADSAMLDENVCGTKQNPMSTSAEENYDDGSNWDSVNLLGIQCHLGAFASEGLRTLVLGIRFLSEEECTVWLEKYEKAAASLVDRDLALNDLAIEIEQNIHIVGTTAIEDKLQEGVPEAINNIGKAGIKLWVLTGDKRETAIEIGYSTKVLHPTMHLTDVGAGSRLRTKALIATEFMRLVKMSKLKMYENSILEKENEISLGSIFKKVGSFNRFFRRFFHKYICSLCGTCNKSKRDEALKRIDDEEKAEKYSSNLHSKVLSVAEQYITEYHQKSGERKFQNTSGTLSTESDGTVGGVFSRAYSAMGQSMKVQNTSKELRSICIGGITSEGITSLDENHDDETDNEDILSVHSFAPGTTDFKSYFNKRKRTLLERMFAVDRDVRKGNLYKHLTRQKKNEILAQDELLPEEHTGVNDDQHRALVIEGSALAHFLGDPIDEEILFAVASCCESVIACRVSPKQKALLVNLVKTFVKPSPVTLAIGDGANDVGMIQEAHIGIGISGLEGQQAVNASDFSIAQFRFLEELLIVHGRWIFIRMSKLILFSFYKNALLASLLICYSAETSYSGIPLFDQWCLSGFNFLCTWPILLLSFFDRDLDREYMKKNPHLYAAGPANECLCLRVTIRWVFLVFLHTIIIFYFGYYVLGNVGAGMSSAFQGLMSGKEYHGDGEGGGLKVYGTVIFLCLNWILSFKVLFESSAIIHGVWPAFTCQKNVGEGFWNRVAYTWHGVIFLSILFMFFFLYIYQIIGKSESAIPTMKPFVMVTWHMFHTRSITWIVLLLISTAAIVADVVLKVFSNMFYPTQTQIHKEIQWKMKRRHRHRHSSP